MSRNVNIYKSSNGRQYVRVSESYRNADGKPRSRTVESHGRLDLALEKDPDFLDKLRARIARENELERRGRYERLEYDAATRIRKMEKAAAGPAADYGCVRQLNVGAVLLQAVWEELRLDVLFRRLQKTLPDDIPCDRIAFLLTAAHFLEPKGMLRARDLQDRTLVDFSSIRNGEDIRRVLEHLAAHRQDVVRHLKKEAERRFGRNVETAVHALAALPAGGMAGVTMDANGIPIDLDIPEDGASDADLLEGIGRTADLHGLERLTVISDCAFENPACLQASGFGFAVSGRICDDGLAKRMPALGGWPRLALEDEEDVFRFGLIEPDEAGPQGLAMIATRSTGKALEDLHELEFSKHGLDADGFLFRRLWAGFRVIRTNLTDESPERIVRLVESLSGMVEPFRLEESASDPVPTGDALKGCIVSAWISLVMEKVVMRVLKENKGVDLTAHQLRQVLREAEVALEDANPQVPFFLRLHESLVFDDMLVAFGLKPLCRYEEKASLRRKLRLKTFPPMA